MTGRSIRLGRRGGRVVVGLAMTAYVAGIMIAGAPPGNTFGGSCNGRLSSVGLDASHEKGPVIIMGGDATDDVIIGSRGDDTIDGRGGNDTICAGAGADDVRGGDDDDAIFGERGDDTLRGSAGNDLVAGGHGNDSLAGDEGEDQLFGNDGHDILNGVDDPDPAEADKLDGGEGRNLCFVDALDEPDDCKF
jgi:Ca2+-binding RTX toxin-like protein